MRLETILVSLLIVMSVVVITEQQAKAQVTNDSSKDLQPKLNQMRGVLAKFEKCNSAENETLCKMNVMGLDDKAAIFVLGLNKSKLDK
jgi:hypothetical protein